MKITKELVLAKLRGLENPPKPNQNKISLPILNRICKKMQHRIEFPEIWISSENLIVEGHHRYIAAILTEYPIKILNNYPTPTVLNDFEWKIVELVEEDWDTPSKIKILNEKDAKYNNMELSQIESIIA